MPVFAGLLDSPKEKKYDDYKEDTEKWHLYTRIKIFKKRHMLPPPAYQLAV